MLDLYNAQWQLCVYPLPHSCSQLFGSFPFPLSSCRVPLALASLAGRPDYQELVGLLAERRFWEILEVNLEEIITFLRDFIGCNLRLFCNFQSNAFLLLQAEVSMRLVMEQGIAVNPMWMCDTEETGDELCCPLINLNFALRPWHVMTLQR